MAKHRASGDGPAGEGVTESLGETYWSVDESRWAALRPDLPAHMVDLLATPIVVGVARVPAASRLAPPAARGHDPARPDTVSRPPTAPTTTAGRHRRTLDR